VTPAEGIARTWHAYAEDQAETRWIVTPADGWTEMAKAEERAVAEHIVEVHNAWVHRTATEALPRGLAQLIATAEDRYEDEMNAWMHAGGLPDSATSEQRRAARKEWEASTAGAESRARRDADIAAAPARAALQEIAGSVNRLWRAADPGR
jgi:hypothetical protein